MDRSKEALDFKRELLREDISKHERMTFCKQKRTLGVKNNR